MLKHIKVFFSFFDSMRTHAQLPFQKRRER